MSADLVLSAAAKINLTLEVLDRRPDGFHEVRMLMAGLSLCDELSFAPAPSLSLFCDHPALDCSESNLILRAARALQEALQRRDGAKIFLKKRIPIGGGLAGGSTDAAAALLGLNRLWCGNLDTSALGRIAADLGSDVPFCLSGGWAYATGRGEKLEPLVSKRVLQLVLANPGFEVSTAWAYGGLGRICRDRGNVSAAAFQSVQAWDIEALKASAVNDLEPVTSARHPEIGFLKQVLLEQGALLSRMSGSGPTVWGLFQNEHEAKNACQKMLKMKIRAFSVQTIA